MTTRHCHHDGIIVGVTGVTVVPASVLFLLPRHCRHWCHSGGGCTLCGGDVAVALARWRCGGSCALALQRLLHAGVAAALRLLRAVRGGGGSGLAEAQQWRGVWGLRDRAWWCGGLHAHDVVLGVEGVARVQRQYLEEDC
ncbi:hypothetical protein EDB85DRAFT_1891009 [Lactarius pseudohatsudake]|nr:hypothetical protein EDB85DRAFT_1891009 [Lactarius pseudohatsudake]